MYTELQFPLKDEGSDKVIIEQSHDNLLNLSETEILILKNIASGKNTVNSADDELSVIMETGKNGMPSDFSILGLPSLSNISVSNAISETAGLGNILINYRELEPVDTILINTIKDFGDFLTENIGDVTVNFAEPVRMTDSDFKFNDATEVEINADESFQARDFVGDMSPSVNSLEKLFITGLRDVSLGSTVNTDKLKTINLNAYNDLIAGNLGAGALSNITLTSKQGDLKISKIDVTRLNSHFFAFSSKTIY